MHRLIAGYLGLAALAACGRPAPAADQTPAEALLARAASDGLAPGLDYACDIWEPEYSGPMLESQEERRAYGALSVRGDRYRLALEDGRVAEGRLTVDADARLGWDGDLGTIDDAPRRVTAARLTAYDDVANLVFDFAPPTEGPIPHRQVICRARFGDRPA